MFSWEYNQYVYQPQLDGFKRKKIAVLNPNAHSKKNKVIDMFTVISSIKTI